MVTRMMRNMSVRPCGGMIIEVFMKDDTVQECSATKIVSDSFTGIMIYHKGKSIDESKAAGWMPLRMARYHDELRSNYGATLNG